ncbi:hypothetical protein CVT24_010838 [Panaeolus cyanescens]|uniref:Uncharacterized protein n=1 Tax=Panaeolus cyanescens TaxID=181874 RepID=A0A409YYH9_9AGAR|nr:hypothetical protein CVT24_010838 [Panaeolus cyanescens]
MWEHHSVPANQSQPHVFLVQPSPTTYSAATLSMDNLSIHPKFEEYLLHNELPPNDIILELNQNRSSALSELANLESDIRIAELTLAKMRERHIALKDALSIYDPIVAPVRRLSEDVLEEIFFHCLPVTRNVRPFVSEAPLLLTLVCKKWREVAYRSPWLWTTLHIPIPFLYSELKRKYRFVSNPNVTNWKEYRSGMQAIRLVELEKWLLRSGTLPLSISLQASQLMKTVDGFRSSFSSVETKFEPLAKSTFSIIAKFANKITDLDLAMPPSLLQWFDEASAGQLLILKRARVSSLGVGASNAHRDLNFISQASIRELSVHFPKDILDLATGIGYMFGEPLYRPLTSLSLHIPFPLSEARTILLACRDLQIFSIKMSGHLDWWDNDDEINRRNLRTQVKEAPHILLPSLHTLCLQGRLKGIEALCKSLDTPLLNRFMLYTISPKAVVERDHERHVNEVDHVYPPENIKALYTFLSRCCDLNHLTIDPSHLLASELQAIFHNTPSVNHLVLENHFANVPGTFPVLADVYGKTLSYTGTISDFVYNLHPLLKQERVSKKTGERTPLESPLLPNLQYLKWNTFSRMIPDDLLVTFIKSRLHPLPTSSTYQDPAYFHLTKHNQPAHLKRVDIRLMIKSSLDIEEEIAQHAASIGLSMGVDFTLKVSTYPCVEEILNASPLYAESVGRTYRLTQKCMEDGLMLETDTTWPVNEI